MSEGLTPEARMTAVTLRVADLDTMTAYYRDGAALDVLSQDGGVVTLGRGTEPVVILEHAPGLRHASEREAGLYHTAIVYDDETALAAAVYSLASRYPRAFTGSSDHYVSEAFYFDDPEGNGVELYRDRPRSTWQWGMEGISMGVEYLDPNRYLREHLTEEAVQDPRIGGARVGHIHLQVGDIRAAEAFYVGALGFDLTLRYGPSAAFASVGGYHHHIGMNTWRSQGAGRRTAGLGLGRVAIQVPTRDDVEQAAARLAHYGVTTRDDGRGVEFEDPWGTVVSIVPEREPQAIPNPQTGA